MKQNYSENDLVRMLYCETSHEENKDICLQLEDNYDLNKSFKQLLSAKDLLTTSLMKPSTRTIQRLTQFASMA